MEGILLIHKDKKITYTLSEEADKLYEKIIDKLNDQFNLKYTLASQLSALQPDLNNNEKSELSVHTKETEIIGRLMCSLWIFCNGKPLYPSIIPKWNLVINPVQMSMFTSQCSCVF